MKFTQVRLTGRLRPIAVALFILVVLLISVTTSLLYMTSYEGEFKIISTDPATSSTVEEVSDNNTQFDNVESDTPSLPLQDQEQLHQRENATLFSLVRNEDLQGMLSSIEYVESRFNKHHHYDWVFVNDKEFTDDFKYNIREKCSGEVHFAQIPEEYWSYPDWIDMVKLNETREELKNVVMYGGSESYRHMCRFNSGFFYKMDVLQNYDYYWRVEPDVKFLCDIEYDPFKIMREGNKKYGFNMAMQELEKTIPSLWKTSNDFFKNHPEYVALNNNFNFLSDDNGDTYNRCHFWSNFEIGDLSFFRSLEYNAFFEYLDQKGGFFYERWGDAPIHTLAVSMILPVDQIQYFDNTGYYHVPNQHCPPQLDVRHRLQCDCNPAKDFTWHKWSCVSKFFLVNGLKFPEGVKPNHSKRDMDGLLPTDEELLGLLFEGKELDMRWNDEL